MRVLKVELEGLTTSFRYPHFMMGRHPTFPMPPPATIYGHLCSALGEWVDPRGIEFGYVFTHESTRERTATDLEHCHILEAAGARTAFECQGERVRANLVGVVNPLKRDFLFRPRLTLYLNRPEWLEQFRVPRYPVVLGRSQDLATYTRVTIVALQEREEAYYENTLLPCDDVWRVRIGRGTVFTMPRFLDYNNNREPRFERYIALEGRVATTEKTEWLSYENQTLTHWVDPETPEHRGCLRGVVFHTFVDDAETGR